MVVAPALLLLVATVAAARIVNIPAAEANRHHKIVPALDEPRLILPGSVFREGDHFTAQCMVSVNSSAGTMTWLLGNETITAGVDPPTVSHNGDVVTVTQNLSRVLTADDDDKMLICRSQHNNTEAKKKLVVQYAPRTVDELTKITIYGLKVGAEARVRVRVRANPAPAAEWSVSGERREGAMEARGRGVYDVTLVLGVLSAEQLQRGHRVRVWNAAGRADLTLALSTDAADAPRTAAAVRILTTRTFHTYSYSSHTGAYGGGAFAVIVLILAICRLCQYCCPRDDDDD